jgi:large subunit ribosomal protein L32
MTPLPKRRHSTRRAKSREIINMTKKIIEPLFCVKCKSPRLPHRACPKCGFYK